MLPRMHTPVSVFDGNKWTLQVEARNKILKFLSFPHLAHQFQVMLIDFGRLCDDSRKKADGTCLSQFPHAIHKFIFLELRGRKINSFEAVNLQIKKTRKRKVFAHDGSG